MTKEIKNGTALVAEQIYDALKDRICSGKYAAGLHLVEADLSEEFGVSRVTIRKALNLLIADEIVELLPHRGIRVRGLSYRDADEIYAVVEVLEGLSARVVAESPSLDLRELENNLKQAEEAVEARDRILYWNLNKYFHLHLAKITDNRTLLNIRERLATRITGLQFLSAINEEGIINSHREHKEIFEAIRSGDGDRSESLMRKHMKSSREIILVAFGKINR